MEGAIPRKAASWVYALAGLQAGVLGSLAMLGWLMSASLYLHRSVWSVPNLFAASFAGPGAFASHFVKTSLAGASVFVVLYGLLGMVWGVACRRRRGTAVTIVAAAFGLAIYALFFRFFWPHVRPVISLYAPDHQLEVAHFLWGLALSRSAIFAQNIARAFFGLPSSRLGQPQFAATAAQDAGGEIRRGEIIL